VSRAQSQGTRRFNISIPIDGYMSAPVPASNVFSNSVAFQPFYNSNAPDAAAESSHRLGSLLNSNLFTTYCGLYDEVKLNSVSLSVAVTSVPESKSAVKVYTCLDRHCNLNDIRSNYPTANMGVSAESSSVMFTSLDRSKIYRYFSARDRQERDTFFDATLGVVSYSPSQGVTWNMSGPLEFLEGGSLYGAFNPIIYLGFQLGSSPAAAGNVAFQFRVVWNLTFRNPKYGVNGNAKGVSFSDMKSEVVEEKKSESGVSEGSALRKKEKVDEPVYEESVIPDDEVEMDDESSQPELTKEQLLEMLRKIDEKKN
jgi:hypothetical protein